MEKAITEKIVYFNFFCSVFVLFLFFVFVCMFVCLFLFCFVLFCFVCLFVCFFLFWMNELEVQ